MKHNTDRILTSHAGNLPRPDDVNELLAGGPGKRDEFVKRLPSAIAGVVDRQIECGVDIVNDGEYIKAGSYTGYIHERVTGWESLPIDPNQPCKRAGVAERDRRDFPGFYESGLWLQGSGGPVRPGFFTPGAPKPPTHERVCTGPVTYTGQAVAKSDVAALKMALEGKQADGFVCAFGPLSFGAGRATPTTRPKRPT